MFIDIADGFELCSTVLDFRVTGYYGFDFVGDFHIEWGYCPSMRLIIRLHPRVGQGAVVV